MSGLSIRQPFMSRVRSIPHWERLSQWSTSRVGDSVWASMDVLLGAGMVIIQENTHKIVVVHETKKDLWFLPKGRKDVGESLEQTALREAHEESGYRVQFMCAPIPTRQPCPPGVSRKEVEFNTEPICINLMFFHGNSRRREDFGGEYLTTWYLGQIPEAAVAEEGTGMPDEQNFKSHLLPFDEAMKRVYGAECHILRYAWEIYMAKLHEEAQVAELRQVLGNIQLNSQTQPL